MMAPPTGREYETRAGAGQDEHREHCLRSVGDGGQGVRRQDRKCDELAHLLRRDCTGVQWGSEQRSSQRLAETSGCSGRRLVGGRGPDRGQSPFGPRHGHESGQEPRAKLARHGVLAKSGSTGKARRHTDGSAVDRLQACPTSRGAPNSFSFRTGKSTSGRGVLQSAAHRCRGPRCEWSSAPGRLPVAHGYRSLHHLPLPAGRRTSRVDLRDTLFRSTERRAVEEVPCRRRREGQSPENFSLLDERC